MPAVCQALCVGASLQLRARQAPALVHWVHQMELKVVDRRVALVLAYRPGTNSSLFDESPKSLALHLQNEAVDRDVICSLQRSKIFTIRDVPTPLRSAAAFISVLFNLKEVAFCTE